MSDPTLNKSADKQGKADHGRSKAPFRWVLWAAWVPCFYGLWPWLFASKRCLVLRWFRRCKNSIVHHNSMIHHDSIATKSNRQGQKWSETARKPQLPSLRNRLPGQLAWCLAPQTARPSPVLRKCPWSQHLPTICPPAERLCALNVNIFQNSQKDQGRMVDQTTWKTSLKGHSAACDVPFLAKVAGFVLRVWPSVTHRLVRIYMKMVLPCITIWYRKVPIPRSISGVAGTFYRHCRSWNSYGSHGRSWHLEVGRLVTEGYRDSRDTRAMIHGYQWWMM